MVWHTNAFTLKTVQLNKPTSRACPRHQRASRACPRHQRAYHSFHNSKQIGSGRRRRSVYECAALLHPQQDVSRSRCRWQLLGAWFAFGVVTIHVCNAFLRGCVHRIHTDIHTVTMFAAPLYMHVCAAFVCNAGNVHVTYGRVCEG